MSKSKRSEALEYHRRAPAGKTEVVPTKPCSTQRDLSLAYTPGVAEPCLEIAEHPETVFEYTNRANLVAVVSNGTAVLGLGNIGALASKPVMEGKGVLFKRFAGIDVFDIELDTLDPEEIIRACKLLEPTVGGINLEDIRAPECFVIEERLREEMGIPVFHDDQHGTAIISGAALLNAAELAGKKMSELRIVVSGAGAGAIACAKHYVRLGATHANILMVDSKGTLTEDRLEELNPYKRQFAAPSGSPTNLRDAMVDADVFVGLSVKDLVDEDMVRSMAQNPIIFALANPDPEIAYPKAKRARPDAIVATGRSDYPNQVNNVLGFPFVFRGALDTHSRGINEEMKVAASHALAELAREDVPESVARAYGGQNFQFGTDYLIPKPFDHRILLWEATAVAKAAMDTGVARRSLDLEEYRYELERTLGRRWQVMQRFVIKAKDDPKRIVYPEGDDPRVLQAVHGMLDEGLVWPILLGQRELIESRARELGLGETRWEIMDPRRDPRAAEFAAEHHRLLQRRGVNREEARREVMRREVFGAHLVRGGEADGMVAGLRGHIADTVRPALRLLEVRKEIGRVAGVQVVMTQEDVTFFADTTMTVDPTAEQLVSIALLASELAREFHEEPVVAMLSSSNFGSVHHPAARKVQRAVEMLRERAPDLIVDGEIQADLAFRPDDLKRLYPHCRLAGRRPNVLVFPDLDSANISYKLIHTLTGAETLGPILVGLERPFQALQPQSTSTDIYHMTAVVVAEAQAMDASRGERPDPLPDPFELPPLSAV